MRGVGPTGKETVMVERWVRVLGTFCLTTLRTSGAHLVLP